MLVHFDPDLVGWLMEKFGTIGIDVVPEPVKYREDRHRVAVRANSNATPTTVELISSFMPPAGTGS